MNKINMKKDIYIVANFGEIFLKGKNIKFFERKLLDNFLEKLGNLKNKIKFEKKSGGSFYLKLLPEILEGEILKIEKIIKNTPGFVNFYRAYFCETKIEKISEIAIFLAQQEIKKGSRSDLLKTFGIKAIRAEKDAQYSSQELGREVGSAVWNSLNKNKKENENEIKVDLNNPDLEINIKENKNKTFLFLKKEKAVGGMPVGSSGKALVFLSGGIDSPVASFYALKRGLKITAVHFHTVPKTNPKSIEKVQELVKVLEKYQKNIKLILVPIIDLQKEIKENCDEKLRLVLLRRAMLKIGEKIARQEFDKKTFTFVTGDSLAQVASQTLENLSVVNSVTDKLILRPLIGFDKSEIMDKAREIGTYHISIKPHDDACSLFVPKKPETKANLEKTEIAEKKYDLERIINSIKY